MPDERMAVVGLGRMGANMARRLKECGYHLTTVFDRDHALTETVAQELGTEVAETLQEVTASADIVLTVVSDDSAMAAIYDQPDDHLLMGAEGKAFINCATVTPDLHVSLHDRAVRAGAVMLEAPMAASLVQAREGSLFLVCAGVEADYLKLKPVLDCLATTTLFVGAPGQAAQLKALINLVMTVNTAALAEGLGLAESLGLDLGMVRSVFAQTGAASRVLETDGEDMQRRDHETYFSAAHAAKDVHIALALGMRAQLPMVLAQATAAQYDTMIAAGLGELDKSGISELTFKARQAT